MPDQLQLNAFEVTLFLEAIYLNYGFDFRNYAKASIKRRIVRVMISNGYSKISELTADVIKKRPLLDIILKEFSITVTEMFRDPTFFVSLRQNVVPYLSTYPFIKIWHAGCATGEEVYSLAILLKEEGIYDKCTIFATDYNNEALEKAKQGIYSIQDIKNYSTNYQLTKGSASLSTYYHANYNAVIMDKSLSKNITFANHNLVVDGVFGEMHLILCRNVLIYFNKELQNRVLSVFNNSLVKKGFLALGSKETIKFSSIEKDYKVIDTSNKIYKKK